MIDLGSAAASPPSEIDLRVRAAGAARLPAPRLGKLQLRPLADGAEPDVDHLDRLLRRMVRVAVLVELVERGADAPCGRRALSWSSVTGTDSVNSWPDVAQVELDLVLRVLARGAGSPSASVTISSWTLTQLAEIDAGEIGIDRAGEIVALVGEQHAERREMRGEQRHDHGRDVAARARWRRRAAGPAPPEATSAKSRGS